METNIKIEPMMTLHINNLQFPLALFFPLPKQ